MYSGQTSLIMRRISYQICFRIVTLRTKNKLFNESIQHVLQLICLMRSIDNETVILNIKLGLCSQLTTKKFGGICKQKVNYLRGKAAHTTKIQLALMF